MTASRVVIMSLITGSLHMPAPVLANAQNYEVRLKRAWVSKFADRTSIDATMDVRHSHHSANTIKSGGDDGDMHFSGVSPQVGLPFVAEIVNAAVSTQKPAESAIIAKEGTGKVTLRGAWRLWFEHPSKKQTQGGSNPFSPDNTNPDHSFEIHPISHVNTFDIGKSFIPVKGYTAYTADVAFTYFEKCSVTVKASNSGISLRSKKLKYNYVEFEIELAGAPKTVSDGTIALATVLSDDGDPITDGTRRMIFVGGTQAEQKVANAKAGDHLRVLGVPRVNLNAILALVAKNGTAQFIAALPYEMIVVGVLEP
jgi:hypothetical protein